MKLSRLVHATSPLVAVALLALGGLTAGLVLRPGAPPGHGEHRFPARVEQELADGYVSSDTCRKCHQICRGDRPDSIDGFQGKQFDKHVRIARRWWFQWGFGFRRLFIKRSFL